MLGCTYLTKRIWKRNCSDFCTNVILGVNVLRLYFKLNIIFHYYFTGMGFRPMPKIDSTLIKFHQGNPESYKKYTENIKTFLKSKL